MPSILFYQPAGVMGQLVSWWTGSPWSHVAIEFAPAGVPVEAHADQFKGLMLISKGRFRPAKKRFDLPWLSDDAVLIDVLPVLGTKYGWRDILSFVLGRKRADRKGLICSEHVIEVLVAHADDAPEAWQPLVRRLSHVNAEDVTPGELYSIFARYCPGGV